MTNAEVCARLEESGIVASVRVHAAEDALFAAETLSQSGMAVIEIAMTVPGAVQVIAGLAREHADLIVGAGSVGDPATAQVCVDAGARFLTSDGLHLPVIEFAERKRIPVFPGALTPTEVITAWNAGCDFVKVVPCAQIGGAAYIRSLHEMYPHIRLIAAGGVSQQTASKYLLAGAAALGVGRELIPPSAIRERQAERITELSHRFLGFVKSARDE